jgi:UDP-glucose:(heptosyl)LPS alpha-1,3-glucosyltransferase
MYRRRTRIGQLLASLAPRITVTVGAVSPPGDVLWVQSVHRAWLEAARTVQVGRFTVPARVRFLMPRHRVLLDMESDYFRHARPRHILCTSRREVDDLGRLYDVDPALCTVVPNPFDPERFNPERTRRDRTAVRQELGIADGDVAMMLIANELHRKGLGQTLEAMALVGDRRLQLYVVGRADLGPYRATITRLGLTDRVHYLGSSADVGRELAAADVMVLPTQYEPFGLVIVEALASGIPVVTSRLAGAAEAVVEGKSGLILEDPYDVSELAGRLETVASADLAAWGAYAGTSVDRFRRQQVMGAVEQVILS